MLKEKDLFLLSVLEKVSLANNRQLMILSGYRDPSVVRKRLNRLKDEGYIISDWLGDHIVYTLSYAGLRELEKTRKPYEIKGIKSEHEELVTEAACLIYIWQKKSVTEMLFDHEMNSQKVFKDIGHKPDIAFSMHQVLEIELSSKETKRLEENFKNNSEHFSRQIWIVPERKIGLISRLEELSKLYGQSNSFMKITVEEMMKITRNYDSSQNYPRLSPTKGLPTPLNLTRKEMVLID